jgi:hypothetical protein
MNGNTFQADFLVFRLSWWLAAIALRSFLLEVGVGP